MEEYALKCFKSIKFKRADLRPFLTFICIISGRLVDNKIIIINQNVREGCTLKVFYHKGGAGDYSSLWPLVNSFNTTLK